MQNNIMFVPGQQFRVFKVYRKSSSMSNKRRVTYVTETEIREIKGSLSIASQREVERFKAIGHPITHRIVIQLRADIQAGDVMERDGKRYNVRGVENPGDLGFYTVVYSECEAGV